MNANHLQQAFPDDVALDYVLDEVKTAIAAIARGEFVLVVDDEHREIEGNLIIAADALTPAHLASWCAGRAGSFTPPLGFQRNSAMRPLRCSLGGDCHSQESVHESTR
ncbi:MULTISPECIES: 3,4-dihydroxy-2-butanone-4-phosphate synthase [unclassified Variovorax]|uniref:3,4-dihydroxy-2-butanone-4-phosphate synthase n=1 Tax=unclassified Variovorax TaxID=663243 RepID=UPI001BD5D182|nr:MULTISPECIES: 3,4-dihydroxy-2-butanone-4-phosphate synthase [unclassified Variovorax]